ncbi:MAG: hypothetical protein SW833_07080 [Cyanobacteriota bacterium]|nr:hypothetical protein [Cyanobacteriota bacterium]
MFDSTLEILNGDRIRKYALWQNAERLCYARVLELWQVDKEFRSFFLSLLSDVPFSAYRWETPAIANSSINRPFEFVLLDSPGLARASDAATYREYFTTDDRDDGIVVFDNLGKDATLVVPSPRASNSAYPHLATFIRRAPDAQKHGLWRIVGRTVQHQLRDRPLWLSTAGGGVSWLHVRLDSRPKYYGFKPYKIFP